MLDIRFAFREMRRTRVHLHRDGITRGWHWRRHGHLPVVDAFMLRGLPVREPDRLVAFSTSDSSDWGSWSYSALRGGGTPHRRFEVAAASDVSSHLGRQRGTEKPGDVRISLVSANYFQVMGVDFGKVGPLLTRGRGGQVRRPSD